MAIKIAINGRCFTRRITGVERYANEITKRLEINHRSILPGKPLRMISGHLWEQFILPVKLEPNEVLWSPANTGPWAIRRQAITIHDASVFDHPEWFRKSFASWTRLSWKILARRGITIITDSSYSRERLKYHLQVPPQKVHVIANGVGNPFGPKAKKEIDETLIRYKLKKPYIFFVGTFEPRKNVGRLFEAWNKLASASHILVIAGAKGNVFADTGQILKPDCVEILGYVSDADLPALYAGATAVIIPSLYEGFGLTILEAMACGTPVIASNTTSFPEVAGEAALMVDPKKPGEIANALQQVIEDNSLANSLRERGFKRAVQFTWDESARKLQDLLGSI